MKKIGPVLSIISGAIGLALAIFGILVAKNIIGESQFVGSYLSEAQKTAGNGNTSVMTIYGIAAGVSAVQILLGMFAFAKSNGFSAVVLMVLFATTTTLAIIAGTKSHSWPTSTIIMIVLNGIASMGLLVGILKK